MEKLLLGLLKYGFLFFFFLFIRRTVVMIGRDLQRESTHETGDELLFYAPEQDAHRTEAILEEIKKQIKHPVIVPVTTLGRAEHNDIQLAESYASYEHARLVVRNDKVYIEDLHSTNGTFLNGVKLREAIELKDGDQIKIGDLIFVFRR